MRIAFLNQTFYPDVASSGQHLRDLAVRLAERGHEVTVITSRRAYDDPQKTFSRRETWRGVHIYRVANSGFGKRAKWRRAMDFATFLWSCWWRLWFIRKQDVVVSMTSPPIVSLIGAVVARIRGSHFCYWIMDLNPDEAVAAGWLRQDSLIANLLERFSRFSMRSACKIIALDEFMRERVRMKGIAGERIEVIPPWSQNSEISFDASGRAAFRKAHGLEDKFVVMYSGNHSPCHPLDTILGAAQKLGSNRDIRFCFVGGGSEFRRVQKFAAETNLGNILCLPYQPLDRLAASLSAADLHLVVMGDPFVGLVHPCKIYNVLWIGAPVLYIGPKPSHISKILERLGLDSLWAQARHGEADDVAGHILRLKQRCAGRPSGERASITSEFSVDTLLPKILALLENAGSSA
jgi:colanic acid biosynthesis glycosyl transferase WcaI